MPSFYLPRQHMNSQQLCRALRARYHLTESIIGFLETQLSSQKGVGGKIVVASSHGIADAANVSKVG